MPTSIDLERRVYRSYWDDGLLDVFAATAVLLIGLCWSGGFPLGAAIVPALFVPVWGPARQKLVEPRQGFIEFSDVRMRRNERRLRLVMYVGVGTLLLAVEGWLLRDRLSAMPVAEMVAGLPAVLLGLLAALTVLLTGCLRFIGYAAILAIAGIAGALAGWQPGPIIAVAGAVMLPAATVILVRFLRANPPDREPGR